jgi:hypothetical protein
MNKLLIITSGLLAASNVFAEFSASALNVDAKVEFNTADVYEGRRRLDQNFVPNIEIGVPLFDDAGDLYVGVGATLGVNSGKSGNRNEVDPYVGFSYDVSEMFTFDFGYTLHSLSKKPIVGYVGSNRSYFNRPFLVPNAEGNIAFTVVVDGASKPVEIPTSSVEGLTSVLNSLARDVIPEGAGEPTREQLLSLLGEASLKTSDLPPHVLEGKKQSHEIYTGIMADVLLNPALYFAYDFTQKKANINGTVHYTFDLGSCGVTGFAIDLGGKVGYTRVKKPYGINHDTKVVFGELDDSGLVSKVGNVLDKTHWFYTGVNADLIYSLNENVKARAGVAFSYNNAAKDSWINEKNHKKHNVWFSSAIEFSF